MTYLSLRSSQWKLMQQESRTKLCIRLYWQLLTVIPLGIRLNRFLFSYHLLFESSKRMIVPVFVWNQKNNIILHIGSIANVNSRNIRYWAKSRSMTCFIYILDSSFSISFIFSSSKFASSSICNYHYSSNDNSNDWLLSFDLPVRFTLKKIGGKAALLF